MSQVRCLAAVVAALVMTLASACQPDSLAADVPRPVHTPEAPATKRAIEPLPVPPASPAVSKAPAPKRSTTRKAVLLVAAPGGDGDSWKDTTGVEYRLGLVNTPELSECFGDAASAKRRQLTAAGFRAGSYSVDDFGRRVAVVHLADGRNLNVWLAANGYADDKYLATYRHEHPALAAQLDPAFAAAKRKRLGMWGACAPAARPQPFAAAPAPPTRAGNCDPSYPTVCIPPSPPDLDCGDITFRRFNVRPPDPHRFDGSDDDGIGCESG